MRATLSIRVILSAILLYGAAAAGGVPGKLGAQEPGSVEGGGSFRLFFTDGTASLIADGEAGKQNQDSIDRMAQILPRWSSHDFVRFLFMAPRSKSCRVGAECNPEQLLWQRMNTATAAIQERVAAHRQRLRFDLIGMAFIDEFANAREAALELPAAPDGSAALDLRTLVNDKLAGESCPWQVVLSDPDLPPVIGQVRGASAIALPSNATVAVGDRALITVQSRPPAAGQAVALWETPNGEWCRATPDLLSGATVSIHRRPARLHLAVVQESDGEMRRFLSALGDGCRAAVAPPSIFGRSPWPSVSKGIGDHLEYLAPGDLRAPAGTKTAHCQVTFLAPPPAAAQASR